MIKNKKLSQRDIVLGIMQTGKTINTYQMEIDFGIMNPTALVREIRKDKFDIKTKMVNFLKPNVKKMTRIAEYSLPTEFQNLTSIEGFFE